jgi:hypothetical protein
MNQIQPQGGYQAYGKDAGLSAVGYLGGAVGAMSAGNLCEAQKQAEIPYQLERLERTLQGCLQGVENLGARLESSVMRREPLSPTADCDGAIKAGPSTPYGSRLHDLAGVAAIINERIQSLSARLEV